MYKYLYFKFQQALGQSGQEGDDDATSLIDWDHDLTQPEFAAEDLLQDDAKAAGALANVLEFSQHAEAYKSFIQCLKLLRSSGDWAKISFQQLVTIGAAIRARYDDAYLRTLHFNVYSFIDGLHKKFVLDRDGRYQLSDEGSEDNLCILLDLHPAIGHGEISQMEMIFFSEPGSFNLDFLVNVCRQGQLKTLDWLLSNNATKELLEYYCDPDDRASHQLLAESIVHFYARWSQRQQGLFPQDGPNLVVKFLMLCQFDLEQYFRKESMPKLEQWQEDCRKAVHLYALFKLFVHAPGQVQPSDFLTMKSPENYLLAVKFGDKTLLSWLWKHAEPDQNFWQSLLGYLSDSQQKMLTGAALYQCFANGQYFYGNGTSNYGWHLFAAAGKGWSWRWNGLTEKQEELFGDLAKAVYVHGSEDDRDRLQLEAAKGWKWPWKDRTSREEALLEKLPEYFAEACRVGTLDNAQHIWGKLSEAQKKTAWEAMFKGDDDFYCGAFTSLIYNGRREVAEWLWEIQPQGAHVAPGELQEVCLGIMSGGESWDVAASELDILLALRCAYPDNHQNVFPTLCGRKQPIIENFADHVQTLQARTPEQVEVLTLQAVCLFIRIKHSEDEGETAELKQALNPLLDIPAVKLNLSGFGGELATLMDQTVPDWKQLVRSTGGAAPAASAATNTVVASNRSMPGFAAYVDPLGQGLTTTPEVHGGEDAQSAEANADREPVRRRRGGRPGKD